LRTFVFSMPGLVRVHQRTEASFQAADPWNGGALTDWNVDAFRWIGENLGGKGSAMSGYDVYSLRSEIDGVVRMLPEVLAALWREGSVPLSALPRLLQEEEPRLKRIDYAYFLQRKSHSALLAVLALLAALAYLALRVAPESGILHALLFGVAYLAGIGTAILALIAPLIALRKQQRRRRMAKILARLRGAPE